MFDLLSGAPSKRATSMMTARVYEIPRDTEVKAELWNGKPVESCGQTIGITTNARVQGGFVVVDIILGDQPKESVGAAVKRGFNS